MSIRRAHRSFLTSALVAVALGCGPDATDPTAPPAAQPELAAAATAPLLFIQVSLGFAHTCGVTTDHRAYCWGGNQRGQLGNGTTTNWEVQTTPVAVAGGLQFRHVSAGYDHTCGLTLDGLAYCWGLNMWGQLGDGTLGGDNWRTAPVAVRGRRTFRQVRAGWSHTCAITPEDVAFCWGGNEAGQLGDGTRVDAGRAIPVRVQGGLAWEQLSGGANYTCGVTKGQRLYCWGSNQYGQLGDASTVSRLTPRAVSGGRSFRQVDAGGLGHVCAVSTDDLAYCWGLNFAGALGDGTKSQRLTPGAWRACAVPPCECRALPHVWRHAGASDVLLGSQRQRPARRRHHHRAPQAGGGRRQPRHAPGERRPVPHLRRHVGRPGLLLGQRPAARDGNTTRDLVPVPSLLRCSAAVARSIRHLLSPNRGLPTRDVWRAPGEDRRSNVPSNKRPSAR